MMKGKILSLAILLAAILGPWLTSCNSSTVTPGNPPPPTLTPTSPPSAEPSPTPSLPIALFIPPTEELYDISAPIRLTLKSLAHEQGWTFKVEDLLMNEVLTVDTRVVIMFDYSSQIMDLVTTHPGVQFVLIGRPGIEPTENLNIIGPEGYRFDQLAFLGGYLAALLTQDWRIGKIIEIEDDLQSVIDTGFRNGIRYYCGLCQLKYPPFYDYPIHTGIDPGTRKEDWKESIELLNSFAVETAFLWVTDYEIQSMRDFIEKDIHLIGIHPPPEGIRSHWIATLRLAPEIALRDQWEKVLANEGGWVSPIPLVLENLNQSLFSEGRQRFFNRILLDVQSGFIDPRVTPPPTLENSPD